MQVGQILQHRLVFFGHTSCEVRVGKVLDARRLRHVLQHMQATGYAALTLRRKLPPFRHDVVLDVTLLLGRETLPVVVSLLYLLPLSRRKGLIVLVVVQGALFLLRIEAVEITSGRRRVSRWRTVWIDTRSVGALDIWLRRAVCIARLIVTVTLRGLSRWTLLSAVLILLRMIWGRTILWRPILPSAAMRLLREAGRREGDAQCQRTRPRCELGSAVHCFMRCVGLFLTPTIIWRS